MYGLTPTGFRTPCCLRLFESVFALHHNVTAYRTPLSCTCTQDPVDRKKALVQKIGSPVLPPSTRVGVRQTEEVKLRHPAAGALGRRFGRDSGPGHQSGSLSRSTPSLNLAEVGMDDTESNDSPSHRPTRGFQSKSEQHNQVRFYGEKVKSRLHTTSLQRLMAADGC